MKDYSNSISKFGIPIGLFFMIYPAMTKIRMEEIKSSFRDRKSILVMLILNYGVAPFFVAVVGYFFIIILFHGAGILTTQLSSQIFVGIILLGVAPCIAMVIVWTDLSKGNLALGVSFVAWNSFIQIISTPMLVYLLARAGVTINPLLILESVLLYLLLPLIAGILTRKFIQNKSYFKAFLKMLGNIQTIALLFTIVVIFWGEGSGILGYPSIIWMIGIVMLTFYFILFHIGYFVSRKLNFNYADSTAIGFSVSARDFEISIAIAISAFSIYPFVVITTAIGPLLEIPLMLIIVWIQLNRKRRFEIRGSDKNG
ncbi:MAG: bile acid:sodium symporter [Thermoplasmata archaeon]|nr:bile acid:sodium symporter [Thermoplasmata archaeon]